MRATILSIGSELLRGDITDTNAAYLARSLSRLGVEVDRVVQMGDRLPDLTALIVDEFHRSDLIVTTGGLGPTEDDLTRQAIAAALREDLYEDESLINDMEARFRSMGRPMVPSNRQQALLIPSALAIPNPNGTAPGWYVERDGKVIVAMPGPPAEMQPMWNDRVLPEIQRMMPGSVSMRALMTFGLGESLLEERIRDILHRRPGVTVATYAKDAGVQVHVTARGDSPPAAQSLLDDTVRDLEERLGEAIFGTGNVTLSQVVGDLLRRHSATVAVMESCTGGQLASLLTDVPGSSDYVLGGVVAYSRAAKAAHGVDQETMDTFGLISPETARAMARAARDGFNATIGLATTGIAGGEPVEGKPPGTVFVAISTPDAEELQEIHRPGRREVIKRFAAECALDLLRRALLRMEVP